MKKIVFLSHIDINLYLFRLHIMKRLIKRGWEVYALIPKGRYFSAFSSSGVTPVSYNNKGLFIIKELKAIITIFKELSLLKPYILHTFVVKSNIYGGMISRWLEIPVVFATITGMGSLFVESGKKVEFVKRILLFAYRVSFSCVKKVIFQNEDDLKFFIKDDVISIDKTYLIRSSGVDLERFSKNQLRSIDTFKVVLISRFIVHKGIIEFCEAAKSLKKRIKNVEFILVGDFYRQNPYSVSKDYLEKMKREGIIKIIRWIDDVPSLLSKIHLLVLPSYREGVPNTLLEGMASGRAIITTDAPGCKETVDNGINGKVISVKGIKDLEKAIYFYYINRQSLKKAGIFGREKAKVEFDKEKIVNMYINLYEESTPML